MSHKLAMLNGARAMYGDAEFRCFDCDLEEVAEPMMLCALCQMVREDNRRLWFTRANFLMELTRFRFPFNVCLIIDEFRQSIH